MNETVQLRRDNKASDKAEAVLLTVRELLSHAIRGADGGLGGRH